MSQGDFNPHSRKGSDIHDAQAKAEIGISIHTPARGVTWLVYTTCCDTVYFNPHSRKGSDTNQNAYYRQQEIFQSTLPQGEWLLCPLKLRYIFYFNPHSRKGSDLITPQFLQLSAIFQSTLPQGEWQTFLNVDMLVISFQSTLPQGEWLASFAFILNAVIISIHTPARGVTQAQAQHPIKAKFQSTLPQGEWLVGFNRLHYSFLFQSTLPQGEWHRWYWTCDYSWCISIHTPARGVTPIEYCRSCCFNYFNPHSRKGSDTPILALSFLQKQFQSTLPQGEWRIIHFLIDIDTFYFNPHSRKGSDVKKDTGEQYQKNFNPHSRKGSDRTTTKEKAIWLISIHTPARGVTESQHGTHEDFMNFNPHSRKGSDNGISEVCLCHIISIHTPARGVTSPTEYLTSSSGISIHTPARGVTSVNM